MFGQLCWNTYNGQKAVRYRAVQCCVTNPPTLYRSELANSAAMAAARRSGRAVRAADVLGMLVLI